MTSLYAANLKLALLKQILQNVLHKLEFYYKIWKLKINIDKCETILFRPSLVYANRNVQKNYKNFAIESSLKYNVAQRLPHKNTIK